MSFKIIFCNDGHMRVMDSEKKPMIPLVDFQKESGLSDYPFMARFWDDDVIFEKNLTIGNFLNCLLPWAEFWSIYTHKDIKAYIKESREPSEVKPDRDKWYAMISYVVEPKIQSKSNKSIEDYEDMNEFFNDHTPPTLLPFWDMDGYYKLTGYKKGEVEHYSLDSTPINEIAHMPLILNHYQTVLFYNDYMINIHGKESDNLFNYEGLGVRKIIDKNNKSNKPYHYVLGDKRHSLRDVVDAFFWWFSSNPTARDEFNNSLKQTIANIDRSEKIADETNSELKVIVADDAFSGIADQFDRETTYFERVAKYSKQHSNTPIKIGKLEAQPLVEKRIERWIVKDKDIKLNKDD